MTPTKPFRTCMTVDETGNIIIGKWNDIGLNCTVVPDTEWVKCSERLPTREDANCYKHVLVWHDDYNVAIDAHWENVQSLWWVKFWKPKYDYIMEPPKE